MPSAKFVPLTCRNCHGDLTGRALDRLAFCRPCGTAWRCDIDPPQQIAVETVVLPADVEPLLWLPAWRMGSAFWPAFFSDRLLTLARIGARQLTKWQLRDRSALSDPPPLGARLCADKLEQAIAMTGVPLDTADALATPSLLCVPLFNAHADDDERPKELRWYDCSFRLFPEDVSELSELLEMRNALAGKQPSGASR